MPNPEPHGAPVCAVIVQPLQVHHHPLPPRSGTAPRTVLYSHALQCAWLPEGFQLNEFWPHLLPLSPNQPVLLKLCWLHCCVLHVVVKEPEKTSCTCILHATCSFRSTSAFNQCRLPMQHSKQHVQQVTSIACQSCATTGVNRDVLLHTTNTACQQSLQLLP